ncbi:MAG: type II toxin-antitoxin system PemK/MazF family toxin [Acidimicrobiaceae bacterium]|nr:type II toxin-antitoxin system PemK/MazF family toxin [Acidimicrobiaceae bacterium]MYJ43462.1 type II toxin-antitoxin system PemK/MazF family toxin [Acidimicrobiaceae bacterium]
MAAVAQGDIWWAESELGRRPVLVVTRNEAIAVLNKVVVAPITRTVRDIPTEVPLDADDGLPHRSAASFDNLRVVAKAHLTERVASIAHRRSEICAALAAMADW